jgi:hypothetical protein
MGPAGRRGTGRWMGSVSSGAGPAPSAALPIPVLSLEASCTPCPSLYCPWKHPAHPAHPCTIPGGILHTLPIPVLSLEASCTPISLTMPRPLCTRALHTLPSLHPTHTRACTSTALPQASASLAAASLSSRMMKGLRASSTSTLSTSSTIATASGRQMAWGGGGGTSGARRGAVAGCPLPLQSRCSSTCAGAAVQALLKYHLVLQNPNPRSTPAAVPTTARGSSARLSCRKSNASVSAVTYVTSAAYARWASDSALRDSRAATDSPRNRKTLPTLRSVEQARGAGLAGGRVAPAGRAPTRLRRTPPECAAQ